MFARYWQDMKLKHGSSCGGNVAAIAWMDTFPYRSRSSQNSEVYVSRMETEVLPFVRRVFQGDCKDQQENAPSHV